MQSGGGGPIRNPGFPAGRAASTSSAASPSSSSSAVSTPHLGFDSMQQQQQQQQQQQLASRQVKWFNFFCALNVFDELSAGFWKLSLVCSFGCYSLDIVCQRLGSVCSYFVGCAHVDLASILSWMFLFLLSFNKISCLVQL